MKKKAPLGQSGQKVVDHIYSFIDSPYFLTKIKELRLKYSIPETGFVLRQEELDYYKKYYAPVRYPVLYITNSTDDVTFTLRLEIYEVIKSKLEISNGSVCDVLMYYLLYDLKSISFNTRLERSFSSKDSMIRISNIRQDIELKSIEMFPETYYDRPVALLIHPDTTRRDLEDFISREWQTISEMITPYKNESSPLKNVKLKKVKARLRDEIISKNINESNKVIAKALAKEKINLEYGNISNARKAIIKKDKKA
jgi:hypothetical protein